MKVKINVFNSSISFNNQEMQFCRNKINLVTGTNGVGKTTIINEIAYDNDRVFSMSYAPQDIVYPDVNVLHYVRRYNKSVKEKDVLDYIKKFRVDNISLRTKVKTLSGGELVKLTLISYILRQGDLLVFDEPTNNLDDESVIVFQKVIEELVGERCVIVISHDNRLEFNDPNEIFVDEGVIRNSTTEDSQDSLQSISKEPKIPYVRIFTRFLTSIQGLTHALIQVLVVFILLYGNLLAFNLYYNNDDLNVDKNVIVVYQVENSFGELNRTYAKGANIFKNIKEENHKKFINLNAIEKVIALKGVDSVYYSDDIYMNKVFEDYYSGNGASTMVSIPEEIQGNTEVLAVPMNITLLQAGRLPKDNRNEVVISENLISEYSNCDVNLNCIGEVIEVKGVKYTVVGINYIDSLIVSYEANKSYGLKEYDIEGFSKDYDAIVSYNMEEDRINKYFINNVIIVVKPGYEKEILDHLITEFPASNYLSYEFKRFFIMEKNRAFLEIINVINCGLSLIVSAIFYWMMFNNFKVNKELFRLYDEYYLKKGISSKLHLLSTVVVTFITLIFAIYMFGLNSGFPGMFEIVFRALLIILIPTLCGSFVRSVKNA